ncbi:hypothetical protein BCR44DRAFT_73610 [Catenaria anguillulae PL171]|uniref:Uncharacterized protein n=1 Tax=Catenaria anguillulae PL171 TaxID=765915 RepID=A0A1Y2HD71_9FUNG|nr:hypothetical protein BCR44DRAFT_73610 [Catenaria anguillulae PL171]
MLLSSSGCTLSTNGPVDTLSPSTIQRNRPAAACANRSLVGTDGECSICQLVLCARTIQLRPSTRSSRPCSGSPLPKTSSQHFSIVRRGCSGTARWKTVSAIVLLPSTKMKPSDGPTTRSRVNCTRALKEGPTSSRSQVPFLANSLAVTPLSPRLTRPSSTMLSKQTPSPFRNHRSTFRVATVAFAPAMSGACTCWWRQFASGLGSINPSRKWRHCRQWAALRGKIVGTVLAAWVLLWTTANDKFLVLPPQC